MVVSVREHLLRLIGFDLKFQVDSYESYSNNTLKSLHSFKYLLGVKWKRWL